jgi:hypothetical protein
VAFSTCPSSFTFVSMMFRNPNALLRVRLGFPQRSLVCGLLANHALDSLVVSLALSPIVTLLYHSPLHLLGASSPLARAAMNPMASTGSLRSFFVLHTRSSRTLNTKTSNVRLYFDGEDHANFDISPNSQNLPTDL